MIVIGVVMSLGLTNWLDGFGAEGFETDQEIGVGLVAGGLIGGALLLIDERREMRRATPR